MAPSQRRQELITNQKADPYKVCLFLKEGVFPLIQLLIRTFVKNYKSTADRAVRTAYGNLACIVSVVCNLLLAGGKIAVGVLTGSVAITADGMNNLSDASSNIVSLVGFKLGARPADSEHPYGHARLEYIVSLAIAFIILMVGVTLAREAIDKIISPESVDYSIAMLIVLIISMLVKLWMGFFTADVGKRIGSSTMSAAAADSISDVAATGAIFISSVLGYFFDINIDGYISLAAALFVLYSGIGIIRDVMGPLLGEAPNKETVDELSTLLLSYDGIIGLHDILIHSYGPGKTIASAHAEVRAVCDLLHPHEMIDRAEREVGEKLGMLLTLHMDPIETDNAKLTATRERIAKAIEGIDSAVHFHDFRMVSGEKNTNLIFDIVVPSGMDEADAEGIKLRIAKAAHDIDPTFRCVITIDRDYTGCMGG